MNTTPSRWFVTATVVASALCALAISGLVSAGVPVDRMLTVNIIVDGKQDWKNVLQWSKATTTQSYDYSTTLRSDGRLFAPNLLDPDDNMRRAIKTEYLRQRGMVRLKAMGVDPKSPTLMQDLSNKAQKASFDCQGDPECISNTGTSFAELMAAAVEPDNSALFEGEPRYLFFFGYRGCANRIRSVYHYQAKGETAWGHNKDHIHPYALDMDADYAGSPGDQTAMCGHFTAVIDTKEQKMFVENIYIPVAHGKVVRTEFGSTTTSDADLPAPDPLQGWINGVLGHAALSGASSTILPLKMPLDGNSTVLGNFTGEAKVTLRWAFTDLSAPRK